MLLSILNILFIYSIIAVFVKGIICMRKRKKFEEYEKMKKEFEEYREFLKEVNRNLK